MINRVLIRIKVVQVLYSYLLAQNEFRIEAPAENPSRDKKYGYALYLDLLMLVLELSGIDVSNGRRESPLRGLTLNKHIHQGQMAKSLNGSFEIRDLIIKEKAHPENFDKVIPSLYRAIADLPAYKNFARLKAPAIHDEVALWLSIIDNLMARDEQFIAQARQDADFTMSGFDLAINMLRSTLSNYGDNRSLIVQARNALDHSMEMAYRLYLSLLQLAPDITREQALILDNGRHKFYPTDADLHPDMRFVENKFVRLLEGSEALRQLVEEHNVTWSDQGTIVNHLLAEVTASEPYAEYMSAPGDKTIEQDALLWRNLFKNVILPSDTLAEALESKSIFWNDDMQEMGTFVLKTIRRFINQEAEGKKVEPILPMYKDEEDSHFGNDLLMHAIRHCDEYKELIEKFVNTSRWDAERLAFMDIVIMIAAIAEIIAYPNIPLAVTLNEYIEIANHYSTQRSGSFINGILFSVTKHLREQGTILKA
ncbi:MAG: hypothetical protein K2K92_08660 [Duncaniella sp.]|nr:hypothetical protein [Duncaniella sp.]